MIFTKTHNMAAAAEHMLTPFMAGCLRIRQFASEHQLTYRPHSMLWLAKGYTLPASMYASQIWGTRFMNLLFIQYRAEVFQKCCCMQALIGCTDPIDCRYAL